MFLVETAGHEALYGTGPVPAGDTGGLHVCRGPEASTRHQNFHIDPTTARKSAGVTDKDLLQRAIRGVRPTSDRPQFRIEERVDTDCAQKAAMGVWTLRGWEATEVVVDAEVNGCVTIR